MRDKLIPIPGLRSTPALTANQRRQACLPMGRALEAPTMSESKPGSMRYWLARLANLRLAVIAHDLFMVWAGWLAARAVSVAGSEGFNLPLRALFMPELLMILIIQGAVFWYTGLYRGLWPFRRGIVARIATRSLLSVARHAG
jgi:hypothetical protein